MITVKERAKMQKTMREAFTQMKIDEKGQYVAFFNRKNGRYIRTGILKDFDTAKDQVSLDMTILDFQKWIREYDTGKDPFMASYPELIDVGVMNHCAHGKSGLCMKAGVQCYQDGLHLSGEDMTLENFKKIIDESQGMLLQCALGGRGDVDQHEQFEEILKYAHDHGVIPNFTSSGLGFTKEIAEICKKYCGAVAISQYSRLQKIQLSRLGSGETHYEYAGLRSHAFARMDTIIREGYQISEKEETDCDFYELAYESHDYTSRAIQLLLDAGVKTNIHFVLGKNSIQEAIDRLKYNYFPAGINAVIFLLHKPVGLGTSENVLHMDDPKLKEFFDLIDQMKFPFKIGFDSCSVPGILNFTKNIDSNSIDTCEGGRYSCYITSDMKMLPCSFDNQEMKWAYDISEDSIQNAWDSEAFDDFRSHFHRSCPTCPNQEMCKGGCPIRREIVLCERKEKDLK